MPLNPNIILQAGNFKTPDYAQTLAQVAQLKASGQEAKLRDLQIAGVERDQAGRKRLSEAFGADGNPDPAKVRAAIAGSGDPTALADYDAKQTRAKSEALDYQSKLHGHVSQILSGVSDQASLDAAKAELGKIPELAAGVAKLPQVYDPAVIRSLVAQGQTLAQNIEAKKAELAQIDAASAGVTSALNEGRGDFSVKVAKGVKQGEEDYLKTPAGMAEIAGAQAAARQPFQKKTGIRVVTNPDGTTTVETDDAATNTLTRPVQTELEKSALGATNRFASLNQIEQSFDPSFLQIGKRAGLAWSGVKARFGNLSAPEKADLQKFATFKATTAENLTNTIREATGSAMGVQEADRIISTAPNAGTGVFDGDDPVTFKAKLDRSVSSVRAAFIRQKIWRDNGSNGKPWELMPLDDVEKYVNKKGDKYAAEIKKADPKASADVISAEVHERLRREFGWGE
jgi:hypothetical protein